MKEKMGIEEVLYALKKRYKIAVIATLTSTLIVAIVTFFLIKPQYEASSKLFIGKEETTTEVNNYDNNDLIMYQKLQKTYIEVIKTKDLLKDVVEEVDANIKVDDVLANLTVVPVENTQILQVKVKNTNPEMAMNIVSSITDNFITLSDELVPNGRVKILDNVEFPKNPVSPNKKMNIAIAFLLGLIGGLGIVFLMEVLDNTFKSKEELERELEIAVLGVIPTIDET